MLMKKNGPRGCLPLMRVSIHVYDYKIQTFSWEPSGLVVVVERQTGN